MADRRVPSHPTGLLSEQVSETAYFFLNLHPRRGTEFALSAGGRERCDPDYVVRRRQYGYTVLEFVAGGQGHVSLDGIKFPLRAGSLFAYRENTACEIHTDATDRLVKYFICLSGSAAARRLARAGIKTGQTLQLPAHVEVQSLFAQIIHEGQARTRFSAQSCDLLFQVLLLKIRESLVRRPSRPKPGFEQFSRLKQLIDADAGRYATLRDLARQAGVSPVAACKLFRQHLGLSPFRYLMRRKLEVAAARVGFSDPYHFSRRFKQLYGVPPLAMRARRTTP
jgi:AraC-like DNA-binding protein